jgi:hypothetical protein
LLQDEFGRFIGQALKHPSIVLEVFKFSRPHFDLGRREHSWRTLDLYTNCPGSSLGAKAARQPADVIGIEDFGWLDRTHRCLDVELVSIFTVLEKLDGRCGWVELIRIR